MSHFHRRTPVPLDARERHRAFNEETYSSQLTICEMYLTTPNIAGMFPVSKAIEQLEYADRDLSRMFTRQRSSDFIRYDFIQHYIAYHRAKIHEITVDIAQLKVLLQSYTGMTAHPKMRLLNRALLFYQEQVCLFHRVLEHRAGHLPHPRRRFHSVGQRFYDLAPGNVASVYEADRADRADIAQHGYNSHGHPVLTWHDSPPDTPPDSP